MSWPLNRLMLGALGIAATASTAHANVEIGGTAGVHVFNHANELGVADTADAPSERNTALFAVRLGVFFNDMFGVEGEFGLLPSESRTFVVDVWNITYRAHLVAQFRADDPEAKLIPFVLAGGGAMQVVSSDNQSIIAKDTDAELYIGAGIKWRVDNGWGLRADLRLMFPPASHDGDGKATNSFTEDFEALVSIYKEYGRPAKAVVDDDPDHDGIKGAQDKCPNEPEDKDGFQDADGCPDPDNDGDGIPDAQDKCPNEPETKNGYQDADGCPDEIPAPMKKFSGVIQGINFKTGDATILATSNKTLDEAVKVLIEFKDVKLEIQGHTDDVPITKGGKFDSNEALSQARAESVKAYMVKKGVEEGRLSAKGYGPSQPQIDPKDLKGKALNDARAKNRRVEFKLGGGDMNSLAPPPSPTPPAPAPKEPAPAPPPPPAPKP